MPERYPGRTAGASPGRERTKLPLQNRVDPWGNLNAVPERGAWLGNRGVLHDDAKRVVAPWRHRAWVTCRLEFKGRHREVFSPHRYSELFFLDEATAFAAGHRPCGECRRERYQEFKALWCGAHDLGDPRAVPVTLIDRQLHAERARRGGGKVTHEVAFEEVPTGAFIEHGGSAWLAWDGGLQRWSPGGYSRPGLTLAPSARVVMLTPPSVAALFRRGLVPQVHPTAERP